jgi:hypothetical protein
MAMISSAIGGYLAGRLRTLALHLDAFWIGEKVQLPCHEAR